MSKRQIIVSAVTSLVLLLIGAAGFQALKNMKTSTVSNKPVAEKIIYVTTAQYPLENIKSELSIDGRLNAYEKITVSAEANGKLENISQTWREGSYFSKGDLLFQVESSDEKLNIYLTTDKSIRIKNKIRTIHCYKCFILTLDTLTDLLQKSMLNHLAYRN